MCEDVLNLSGTETTETGPAVLTSGHAKTEQSQRSRIRDSGTAGHRGQVVAALLYATSLGKRQTLVGHASDVCT
jgi:hypothetical protein